MKLNLITESVKPDYRRAIISIVSHLVAEGYKLVEHTWEQKIDYRYKGLFVARYPEKLANHKLDDLDSPDAYHLGRYLIEERIDWGGYRIVPEYKKYENELNKMYPHFDEFFYIDGLMYLPDQKQYEDYLIKNEIPYTRINPKGQDHPIMQYFPNGYEAFQHWLSMPGYKFGSEGPALRLDIVEDKIVRYTKEIDVYAMLAILEDIDLPIIAKRLFDILDGKAPRWVEYRLKDPNL